LDTTLLELGWTRTFNEYVRGCGVGMGGTSCGCRRSNGGIRDKRVIRFGF